MQMPARASAPPQLAPQEAPDPPPREDGETSGFTKPELPCRVGPRLSVLLLGVAGRWERQPAAGFWSGDFAAVCRARRRLLQIDQSSKQRLSQLSVEFTRKQSRGLTASRDCFRS